MGAGLLAVKSGFILFIKSYQFPSQINTLERERFYLQTPVGGRKKKDLRNPQLDRIFSRMPKKARQEQKLQLHSSLFQALAPIKPSLAQSHKKNKCSSRISLAESLASLPPSSKHACLLHILPYSPWQDHGVFQLKMKETGEITLFENLNKKDKEIESLRRELLRVKAYVPDEAGSLASLPRQRDTGEDLAHKIDYEECRLQEYTLQMTSPVSERKFNELKVYLSVSVV